MVGSRGVKSFRSDRLPFVENVSFYKEKGGSAAGIGLVKDDIGVVIVIDHYFNKCGACRSAKYTWGDIGPGTAVKRKDTRAVRTAIVESAPGFSHLVDHHRHRTVNS